MAASASVKESFKEMKRLKNEPLLLIAIIGIILFVGLFVIFPVVRVITVPELKDYAQLFTKVRWATAREEQPLHDAHIDRLLHGGGVFVCVRHCASGRPLQRHIPVRNAVADRLPSVYRRSELYPPLWRAGRYHQGPVRTACGYLRAPGLMDRSNSNLLSLRIFRHLWRYPLYITKFGVRRLQYGRFPLEGVSGRVSAALPARHRRRRADCSHQRVDRFRQSDYDRRRSGPSADRGLHADLRLVRYEDRLRTRRSAAGARAFHLHCQPVLGRQALLCDHHRQGGLPKSLPRVEMGQVASVQFGDADHPVYSARLRNALLWRLYKGVGVRLVVYSKEHAVCASQRQTDLELHQVCVPLLAGSPPCWA